MLRVSDVALAVCVAVLVLGCVSGCGVRVPLMLGGVGVCSAGVFVSSSLSDDG